MAYYNGGKILFSPHIHIEDGNIGYKVTFKIDDDIYYIASCLQGGKITKPANPTGISGTFNGWLLNGDSVSFPFIPNADVELTADITE